MYNNQYVTTNAVVNLGVWVNYYPFHFVTLLIQGKSIQFNSIPVNLLNFFHNCQQLKIGCIVISMTSSIKLSTFFYVRCNKVIFSFLASLTAL